MILQEKNTRLNYFTYVVALQYEYKEISTQVTVIYSYMLVKYSFFKSKAKQYYESIESIAENCVCSTATVKTALKQLSTLGLITISKLQGAKYNKNCYQVEDRYKVMHNKSSPVNPIKPDWDDDNLPDWLR